MKSIGLEETNKDEEHTRKLNRAAAVELVCKMGNSEYSNKMREDLNNWLESGKR